MKDINFLGFIITLLRALFPFVMESKKSKLISTINMLDAERIHLIVEESELSMDVKDSVHDHINDLVNRNSDCIINIASTIAYEIAAYSSSLYTARYIKKKGKFHLYKYTVTIVDCSNGRTVYRYQTNSETKLTTDHIYQTYGIYLDQICEAMDLRGLRFKPRHIFRKTKKELKRRKMYYAYARAA